MNTSTYPSHADYNDAVKYIDRLVLDPVLKRGTPRSRSGAAVARGGALLAFAGGFAKVYIVDLPGKTYALRVWLSKIDNIAPRYSAISRFLSHHRLRFFVEFEFISDGIVVNGRKYPILRMEWVNGYSLADFIKVNLAQSQTLRDAAEEFRKMVGDLHKARVCHGDLQAENMILRMANGTIDCKLIDYDTLVVPSLIGQPVSSTGLPEYQHPRRAASKIATEKDDYFSQLVIYLSLRAIAEDPSLWSKFPRGKRDKELLFQGEDFNASVPTPVFRKLHAMGGDIQRLAVILWNFSRCHSISHLLPLDRVIALAAAPKNISAPVSGKKRPTSAFDSYLKTKLRPADQAAPLPQSWLDDSAFAGGRVRVTRQQTPPSTVVSIGSPTGTERTFAEVLSGMKAPTFTLSPTPTRPRAYKAPVVIGSLLVIGVIFLVIASLPTNRFPQTTGTQPSNPPTFASPTPRFSVAPTATATISAQTDGEWDALLRELRARAKRETATPTTPVPTTPTETPYASPAVTYFEAPTPSPPPITYRVARVLSEDSLNLRQGPGTTYEVVAKLPANLGGIHLLPGRYANGETIWQEIYVAGYHGFVNEIYLEAEQ